jgi:hypothetical protein
MKFIVILMLFTTQLFSQIIIDDVGEGWKKNVIISLELIKKVDSVKYNIVEKYCKRIGFWNGKFSTTEGDNVILISKPDIQSGNINNLAAIIIHESKHLYYRNNNIILIEESEEILSYQYELDFLLKIPMVEEWLINHTYKMINHYQGLLSIRNMTIKQK